jgi:hypothetical protein
MVGGVTKGQRAFFLVIGWELSRCQTFGPTGEPVGAGVAKGQRALVLIIFHLPRIQRSGRN